MQSNAEKELIVTNDAQTRRTENSNMRFLLPMTVLAAACMVQGCDGFRDAKTALDTSGPTSFSGAAHVPGASPSLIGIFELSYMTSLADAVSVARGIAAPDSSIHGRQMTIDGYHLVDSYCTAFFANSGDNQKWLQFAKDLIAVLGTAATGAIGISSGSNGAATGIVALVTGTAYNSVDVYTRNFLFGADNIESIHLMVFKALASHSTDTIPTSDDGTWTFGKSSGLIADHQNLCTPAKIRDMVLEAVKGGTPVAFTPAGTLFHASDTPAPVAAPAANTPAATIPQVLLVPAAPAASKSTTPANGSPGASSPSPHLTTRMNPSVLLVAPAK